MAGIDKLASMDDVQFNRQVLILMMYRIMLVNASNRHHEHMGTFAVNVRIIPFYLAGCACTLALYQILILI